jgi:3-phosphoshikimate 1-carboxyvinyltransferase
MQADQHFLDRVVKRPWQAEFSRRTDLADSIMTAIVLAPFGARPTRFIDLGRLRVQECERVAALRTELTRCGARVDETGDTLTIHPGPLHGAEIETYDDHRVAMCFGMLALRVPGMRLRDPACVRKTFPNFFVKLAELGAEIRDAGSGELLTGERLLA